MTQPHLVTVARFVRDLLDYDEQLILFDRENIPESDFSTNYIIVDGTQPQTVVARGQRFDGEQEVMTYTTTVNHPLILEFWGDDAFSNAEAFMVLSESQHANELRRVNALTIMAVSLATDVNQLLDQPHSNRIHLTFNVQYTTAQEVPTLRIDTPQFQFLEDK